MQPVNEHFTLYVITSQRNSTATKHRHTHTHMPF